jgi:NhaP-type Na+/H+ or K+/H+ antiporter
MKTFLFVYIGVSMRLSGPATLLAGALVAALLFLVRLPAVHLSLAPSCTTRFDAAMCGAMGAKGLAAAVVASIPVQMGLPRGQELQLLVFAGVLATIVATAGLVLVLERGWLPRPQRWLFGRYPEVKQ